MPIPRSKRVPKQGERSGAMELTASASIEIHAAAEGESPKSPTFRINAYNGGMIRVGYYWPYPSVIDLSGLKASAKRIPILLDHWSGNLVGQATDIEITDRKVNLAGIITGDVENPETPAGLVMSHAKRGYEWQASVGVRPDKSEFIEDKAKVTVNGKTFTGPLWVVRQGSLGEVSFVALGADGSTAARIAANAAKGSAMKEFHDWLRARNFDPATLDESQTEALQAAFDAEQVKATGTPKVVPAPTENADDATNGLRASGAAEVSRQKAIKSLCGDNDDLAVKAIGEGWSAERTELEVLRARDAAAKADRLNATRNARPTPAIHAPQTIEGAARYPVMEAAVCRELGLRDREKQFDVQTLEAADRTYRRGSVSLNDLLIEAAEINGMPNAPRRLSVTNLRDVLAYAFAHQTPGMVKASGFSTNNISNVLANVQNKFALQAYLAVGQEWRKIARISNVKDFKQTSSVRLTASNGFAKVGPGGEIPMGALGDQVFNNQADTFAQRLGLTRQDIINDDLGLLSSAPLLLGRNAALRLNVEFWTEFMDNASFFTTGNGNYADGSTTALGYAALDSAVTSFMKQTDANSNPLGAMPKFLVVPTELGGTAEELFIAREIRNTTASTKEPTANRFEGRYEPVVTPYLSTASISGYSTKKWYIIADPNDLAVIDVAFLNGVQAPTIETAEADFSTLGIQMRGYFDFGVAKMDYRAGVARKGEA